MQNCPKQVPTQSLNRKPEVKPVTQPEVQVKPGAEPEIPVKSEAKPEVKPFQEPEVEDVDESREEEEEEEEEDDGEEPKSGTSKPSKFLNKLFILGFHRNANNIRNKKIALRVCI